MAAAPRTLRLVGIIMLITSIVLFGTGVYLKTQHKNDEEGIWGSPFLYGSLYSFLLSGAAWFIGAQEQEKSDLRKQVESLRAGGRGGSERVITIPGATSGASAVQPVVVQVSEPSSAPAAGPTVVTLEPVSTSRPHWRDARSFYYPSRPAAPRRGY